MTKTYTIATVNAILIAVTPDGGDIEAAIREEEERAGVAFDRSEIRIFEGCTLTDEVEDGDEVVYRGHTYGHLTDEQGRRYSAAVIRK
jgi:hypothetical protein